MNILSEAERIERAERSNDPAKLEKLAADENNQVRWIVAGNEDTSASALEKPVDQLL